MSSPRDAGTVRARDVDRDAAVDVVESAWADGQLSREEYDDRVGRLLRATTLAQLDREVVDLQPEGTTWRPGGPVRTSPAPRGTPPAASRRPARDRVLRRIGAVVGAVAAVGVLWAVLAEESGPSLPGIERLTPGAGRVTGADFVKFRESLWRHADTEYVYVARLTGSEGEATWPVGDSTDDALRSSWDGEWDDAKPAPGGGERLKLSLVSASVVDAALAEVAVAEGDDTELSLLFRVSHESGGRVCFWVESAGAVDRAHGFTCGGAEVAVREDGGTR